MKYCTATELAYLLNLSKRRIYQLVKENIIPKEAEGKYESRLALQGYVKYLQDLAANRGNNIEQKDYKSRLLKAQAEKAELELEVLKDKYIETAEVEFTWENLIITFRSRMLCIPAKLVRQLANAGGDFVKIEKILEDEIHDALTELGKYEDEEEAEHQEAQAQANA